MELKAVLQRLEGLYDAAGASKAASDVRAVAELFDGRETQTVEAFIAETKTLLAKPVKVAQKAGRCASGYPRRSAASRGHRQE